MSKERNVSAYATVRALVLALTVVGCRGTGAAAAPPTTARAPAPVEQAEALAEDVQTDVAQGAWPVAEAGARELRSLGEKLHTAGVPVSKQSGYGPAVDSLSAAISRRSQSEALTAGNHVSRIVTGIMGDYPSKVPVEVAYMDVAGRDVLYAAQQGRWSDAAAPMAEVARSYSTVQPYVRTNNFALDQVVTSKIAQLRSAVASREARQVTSLAQILLDDVGRIELIF